MAKREQKRMLATADWHAGHRVGLTPPKWNFDVPGTRDGGSFAMREQIYQWFTAEVDQLRPIDILLADGDLVDGRDEKGGGVEQLYLDRIDQTNIATDIVNFINAKQVIMAYGTAYHTGTMEDWERLIAQNVGAAKISGEDNVEIYDNIVNYRHHVGRSAIPHGRATALLRQQLWNMIWAERGEYPKANIIVRAHVHYHIAISDATSLAMILPAMTGYGGKFGTRVVDGTIDIGFVHIDFYPNGAFTWQPHILRLPMHEALLLS